MLTSSENDLLIPMEFPLSDPSRQKPAVETGNLTNDEKGGVGGLGMLGILIECFHSRAQHLCKFIGTRESVCIRKEFNSQRIGLGHQHGRRFIVWDTDMAAMTSWENTLLTNSQSYRWFLQIQIQMVRYSILAFHCRRL